MPSSPVPHRDLTRRQSLGLGAALMSALALGPARALAQEAALAPITKPIPATGERIPVIGVGTNQYSVETEEDLAGLQQALEAMAEQGGSVIDTARAYGRAEEVIGELLRRTGLRDHFFIVTKTPISGGLSDPDAEVQASFDRLGVDMIDVMLIHNLHGLDELMPALVRAKEQGRVRYIGMSTSSANQYAAQMAAMRTHPLDFIQVDYSISNRGAADEILPLAAERNMAVMVNMPFGGRRNADSIFGQVSGVPLPDWAADIDATSWAQIFLKYVVSHPAVTVAIPGAVQVRHIVDNQGAGRGRLPDAAQRLEIERFWDAM